MSEEKKTYGNMEAEWPDPRSRKSLLQQAEEEHAKEEAARQKARETIISNAGQRTDRPYSKVAFSILELADAIRDFPRLWMEAVKKG